MELLAQSSFSFLRGAAHPEALLTRAAELGHSSLGIVDDNGFYGSARAQATAHQLGLRALVGTTLTGRTLFPLDRLPVLVKSRLGYQTLSTLLTQHHCQLKDQDHLIKSPSQLPSLSGLHAVLTPHSLTRASRKQWLEAAQNLRTHFGPDQVSIALFRHHLRGEERKNQLLTDLAHHLHLPLLAANAPLYLVPENRPLADAFTCLRHHCTLDDAGLRLQANSQRFLKSPRDLATLFADLPKTLHHATELSERCEFSLQTLGYQFPNFTDPETSRSLSPEESHHVLTHLARKGLKSHFPKPPLNYQKQLQKELHLIGQLRFSGYFLIVWDIFRYARSQGILCQGRGSAANSLVCYLIGVTAVDPVANQLLFERFLSENRTTWPDIDIDLPSGDRREAVIQYVYQKYAPRGAAMTANVITYRPRSAFREMSKVLGFSSTIADRFSEFSTAPRVQGDHPGGDLKADRTSAPPPGSPDWTADFLQTVQKAGIPREHPRLPALIHLYQSILHHPRHLGQHSGGIVICDTGLDQIVPLEPARMPGRTIIQWDKDDCSDLGLVKVDLLGLGMLAAMEDTITLCRQRGHPIDLATIPKDDPATYDLMCRADTIGTFQVESRAQMSTLPIMHPRKFYDVAIEVALIRPGPIVGDLVHPYLNRRTGREPVTYTHPSLRQTLARTLGVPLFQEQVLRMAMILADFTGSEADQLRQAMSSKRSDERMQEVTGKLRQRMSANGISETTQQDVIQSIGSFALYGFPESHAISFALIAYTSCWLKVHRPAEFYCGLINNQPMGFYNVNTLLQDARRHHVRTKPVCVCQSQWETIVVSDHFLRLGFHRLKGFRQTTADRILEKRAHSQFQSLTDFLTRVRPNLKERRLLAATGALNSFPELSHRRDALWQVEKLPENDLFTWAATQKEKLPPTPSTPSPLPPMQPRERLLIDFHLQGHSIGPHPMKIWRKGQPSHPAASHTSHSLTRLPHGTPIQIGGLVICRQRPGTAKGHCFLSLEDEHGIANVFVPRQTFHDFRILITAESFLLIHGYIQITEGRQSTIYALSVEGLPRSPQNLRSSSHDFH